MSSLPPAVDFDAAVKEISNPEIREAVNYVHDIVGISKKIMLSNRVQQFTAADVVQVARIVIERIEKTTVKVGADE